MDLGRLEPRSECEWVIEPKRFPERRMRVPGVIYGSRKLLVDMDDKVFEQLSNVATLPGIVKAAYAMPDAHWGYGFPIGGVAVFDPDQGGVVSAGGVGFDISCGVRLLATGLDRADVQPVAEELAEALFQRIPAGVGSKSSLRLSMDEMDDLLRTGARWALARGYGLDEDLERIEERGCMAGAEPEQVSERAKKRQLPEMGTLGSGNHYFEVQVVDRVFEPRAAAAFGLEEGKVVICIHCGSRGLGHQIGTDFLRLMALEAPRHKLVLPDRELACAPLKSDTGRRYLGAMKAGINCALANRQILTHFARETFAAFFPGVKLSLVYDVSHNTCKEEEHEVDGVRKKLFVHRKGATRAFGPGHPALPPALRPIGQPVLIGGSMGVGSFVLVGADTAEARSFASSCHGAGRAMSRTQASKLWRGEKLIRELRNEGIIIKSGSFRGVAEEAPGAYKDVAAVAEAGEQAGLSRRVACLRPILCVKG